MAKATNTELLNQGISVEKEFATEFDQLLQRINEEIKQFAGADAVLIGNCPATTVKTDLDNFFHGFATIVKLHKIVCSDIQTTLFVAKFDSIESASRSMVLNTLSLNGKKILLIKADGKQLFDKNTVVELKGLQEHAEEIIYDHMITFGNINFILKTSAVTYIVFEEATAVKVSCQCDYLDKYPVTIRPIVSCLASGATGASIETCILDQIIQNDNVVEEEAQINTFMRLLDMENLDDYLEVDDQVKNADLSAKALLEIGNEEIIVADDESSELSEEGADVDAIEKQALCKKVYGKGVMQGFVMVDVYTARLLKLNGSILRLSKLPQLQVLVQDCKKEKLKLLCNKVEGKIPFRFLSERQEKISTVKLPEIRVAEKRKAIKNTKHDPQIINTSLKTILKPVESSKFSQQTQCCSSNLGDSLKQKHFEIFDRDLTSHSDSVNLKFTKKVAYVKLVKLNQKEIEEFSHCRVDKSEERKEKHPSGIIKREDAEENNSKDIENTKLRSITKHWEPEDSQCPMSEGFSPITAAVGCDLASTLSKKEVKSETIRDANIQLSNTSTKMAIQKSNSKDFNKVDITVSDIVYDNCNAEETGPNLSSNSFQSDEDGPLIIDLPVEQETVCIAEKDLSSKNKTHEAFVFVDIKSAVLLDKYVRHDNRVYLADLPCLNIKIKRLLDCEYKNVKSREAIRKAKPCLSKRPVSMSAKKRVGMIQEKPRKTDLDKIDNKFLPAGSKLKAQAKAKYKSDISNKNKHVPVPELPIELKAHLNTNFKIPKKHIAVKPHTIERNPSELNCLHKDQTARLEHHKRFHKDRKYRDDRMNKLGPREKKLKHMEQDSVSTEYFNTFYENCDSPTADNNQDKTRFPQDMKSMMFCDQRAKKVPSFEDIWDIPIVQPNVSVYEPKTESMSVSEFGNTLLNSDVNETTNSVGFWAADKRVQQHADKLTEDTSYSVINMKKGQYRERKPVYLNNTLSSTKLLNQQPFKSANRTIEDGESWSPEAETRNNMMSSRTQLKFNLDPQNSRSQERQNSHDTIIDETVMRDSEMKMSHKQTLSIRAGVGSNILAGEMWDEEIEQKNISDNHDRQKMQQECNELTRRNPLKPSDHRPKYAMENKDDICSKQWSQKQERSRESHIRSSGRRRRSRSPLLDRRRSSINRSPRRSFVCNRETSFNRERSRSRSPRIRNKEKFYDNAIWSDSDRSPNQHRAWSRSNYRSQISRSKSPDARRRDLDRSPLNSRHGIYQAQHNKHSGMMDGKYYADSSSIVAHSPSVLDEYNRNSERLIYSQNRRNSPDDCWNKSQRRSPISHRIRSDQSIPNRHCNSPEILQSPTSERQNSTDRSECPKESSNRRSNKFNVGSPLSERWSPVSKYASGVFQKHNNPPVADQYQPDSVAYSPSAAWDAISSEEDDSFNFSAKNRVMHQDKTETIPLVPPQASCNTEVISSCNSNLDKNDENKSCVDGDSMEKVIKPAELVVITESKNLQSHDQLKEDTTEKKNVLEHLKQRAERLKQLEEMKLARQKLLAQIKLKSDNKNLNVESDVIDTNLPLRKNLFTYQDQQHDSGAKMKTDEKEREESALASSPIAPLSLFETAGTLLSHLDLMLSRPAPVITPAFDPPSISKIASGLALSVPTLPKEIPPPFSINDPVTLENIHKLSSNRQPANQLHVSDKQIVSSIDLSLPPPEMNPQLNLQESQNIQHTQQISEKCYWQSHSVNALDDFRIAEQQHRFSAQHRPNFHNAPQEPSFQLRPPEEVRQNNFELRRLYMQQQEMMRDPRHSTSDNGLGVYSRHNNNNFNKSDPFQRFGSSHVNKQRFQQNKFKRNKQSFPLHNYHPNNLRDFEENCFDMNVPGNNEWFE
ncbi:uncharacterized protein LOC129722705 [Wyeomyia smithii]|uniref:uncharacterized protein LOC129722705 n=1 Tax=Wyeomyia smithii TaxID=174621 RepID=UPI0024680543|nr:uncharacterized protein LOC129722705 [Wyeomyia smithii]